MSNGKREDLQGIRGVAIISVILFHFLPSIFPNGYIGVDEFFVLSGYLMCQLLINQKKKKKKKNKESSDIFIFYIRRLKRILPLYFLILFLSIISIFTLFPFESIHLNVISAKNAALFISNRPKTQDEDYFHMLTSAMDVFTHTWSLSVEVQFYVIVPFMFFIGYHFFTRFQIPYYFGLGMISYIYSVFFLTETDAFYSVPARIWQFLVGMTAFLYTKSQNSSENTYQKLENGEKEDSMPEGTNETNKNPLLILIFLIASFVPIEIPSEILRPGITVMTGILMVSHRKSILESRILTYFGDISYSLYLIHWPIYAFWKSNYSQNDTWNTHLFIALAVSILLAMISYHFYEKWYLKQSDSKVFFICGTLFLLITVVLYRENFSAPPPSSKTMDRLDGLNMSHQFSYEEAAKLNAKWSAEDIHFLRVPSCEYGRQAYDWMGYCRHKGLNSTGKHTVMLIGNSWAANQARLMYQECGPLAKTLSQFSLAGCEPLHSFRTPDFNCENKAEEYENIVRDEKPDYLIIVSKFMKLGAPINVPDINEDPIYQEMRNRIDKLSEFVKYRIFIMHQVTRMIPAKVPEIVEAVKEKKNLTEFDISLIEADATFARLRYEKMVSGCPKCELFDYKPLLFNETTGTWRFYDERNSGLSYINSILHLTPYGMELVRPVVRDVCEKISRD